MAKHADVRPAGNKLSRPEDLAWVAGHDVQFYETDEFLYSSATKFLVDGIRAGQPFIVIATEAHRAAITECMERRGIDVENFLHGRDAIWLDARDTLSSFMVGSRPDAELFDATVGAVFEKLMRERRYLVVRAYGEMVDLLWRDGNTDGAIALEEFWNDLARKHSFWLMCAYSKGHSFKEVDRNRICATHGRTFPSEIAAQAG